MRRLIEGVSGGLREKGNRWYEGKSLGKRKKLIS